MDKLKVSISNSQKDHAIPTGIRLLIRKCCHAALQEEDLHGDYEVSVRFVNNDQMRELNRDFRGINETTDVLSFPAKKSDGSYSKNENGAYILGDIAISVPKVYEQADRFGHTIQREFAYLTVHAILHLFGYDHESGGLEMVRMREKEESVLAMLGLQRDASYVYDHEGV